MCSEPIEMNGQLVACRTCDDCLNTRKNTWVARCMAEKEISPNCFMVNLSYKDNPDGSKPISARVFNYRDIQLFLKSLRKVYKDKYAASGEIRFIACGERGSKGSKRLHWHLIIWSNHPITELGTWKEFHSRKPTDIPEMGIRYSWSISDHGHCYFKEPYRMACP